MGRAARAFWPLEPGRCRLIAALERTTARRKIALRLALDQSHRTSVYGRGFRDGPASVLVPSMTSEPGSGYPGPEQHALPRVGRASRKRHSLPRRNGISILALLDVWSCRPLRRPCLQVRFGPGARLSPPIWRRAWERGRSKRCPPTSTGVACIAMIVRAPGRGLGDLEAPDPGAVGETPSAGRGDVPRRARRPHTMTCAGSRLPRETAT